MEKKLQYWKARCEAAEKYIKLSPCDPDIFEEQLKAYKWWKFFEQEVTCPKVTQVKLIKDCSNCPLCRANDMTAGFECRLMKHPDNFIKEDDMVMPITPEWCPLDKADILLTKK